MCIRDSVEGARFALVERVAEEVAELLLARFNSPWVRIKLSKPGAVAREMCIRDRSWTHLARFLRF